MKFMQFLWLLIGLSFTGASLAEDAAWPQQRPIRMLVGMPAGYSPDIVTRQLADELSKELRQTIVVDNKPGGGGALMMRALRAAPADGYTIASVFWNQMSVAPSLFKQLGYDPVEDFTHVGIWMDGAQILVAHPASGIGSVAQLVAKARAANPPLLYASMGVSAPSHLLASLMLEGGAFTMEHVPFSGQKAVQAVATGEVPVAMMGVADALPLVRAGRLVPLAVTGSRRVPALPEVPTLVQAGIPGVTHKVWAGLLAPLGTPAEVITRLNQAMVKVAANPQFRARMEEVGRNVDVASPAQMRDTVREEIPFWREVVRRAGINAE